MLSRGRSQYARAPLVRGTAARGRAQHIFEHIRTCTDGSKRFLVRASYLQIYNESISDLLKAERSALAVREDRRRGLYVEGLSEWVVRSTAEVGRLLARGQSARATGSTRANELSSRSHAVVLVVVEQASVPPGAAGANGGDNAGYAAAGGGGGSGRHVCVGKLNLVDLAGSERLSASDASGARLQESKKINTSLSALGNVVAALSDRANGRLRAHIPYRDSKLTRLLEDSLGGNCKTTLIALVSPAAHAFPETLSTLKFATRAKTVRNQPTINVDDELDQGALLREYEAQLSQLRAELAQRSRTLIDSARLLELEQLHRRAEEDRLEAMRALEQRTSEYLSEKAGKRALEARIADFQSQLLGRPAAAARAGGGDEAAQGGADAAGGGVGTLGAELLPYGLRLEELERDRAAIEEDKAQVVRYKALLVKQRELMLALTRRLTERDASLLALQAELDAADARALELEDELDARTLELLTLQRVALEHGVPQGVLAVSPAHTSQLLARYGPAHAGVRRALEPIAEGAAGADGRAPISMPKHELTGAGGLRGFAVPRPFDDGDDGGAPDGTAPVAELRARLGALRARNAQLERALGDAQHALAETEDAIAERVRDLVDAEVERVAADAVEVVAEARAARAAADALQADAVSARHALSVVEGERDGHAAQLRAVEAELGSALADARTMLARAVRADGVPEAARASALAEAALGDGGDGSAPHERVRALRRVCAAALSVSASVDPVAPRPLLLPSEALVARAEASEKHVLRLKHRCAAHVKERAALTSILDKKVKVLVDELVKSLSSVGGAAVPAGAGHAAAPGGDGMAAALKQVGVLQKLVHAAVAALKMPDAAGESGTEEP